jgi:hypothetical protein
MGRCLLAILSLLYFVGVAGAQVAATGAPPAGQNTSIFYSMIGCKVVDGNHYAATGAGLQQAVNEAAAAGGWGVCIPAGTTVNVDTSSTGPISISTFAMEIVGIGEGSAIAFTGTNHLFTVSAGDFQVRNILIQSKSTTDRTNACVFYAAKRGNYYAENLKIVGAASINNGDIFCGTVEGGGSPDVSHITIPGNNGAGTPTWNSWVRVKGSASMFTNDTTIDRLYGGGGCADACLVADTGTGGMKISNSIFENYYSPAPVAMNFRNSQNIPTARPNNIVMLNTFAESGSGGTTLKIDDCHLCTVMSSYLMGGHTAVAINGGLDIDISHNQIGSSQQNLVYIGASASSVSISQNHFVSTGLTAHNAYASVLVQANANGWQFTGNQWEYQEGGKLPSYCLHISNGASRNFRVIGNDFSNCKAGTGALNNAATGSSQVVLGNTGQ